MKVVLLTVAAGVALILLIGAGGAALVYVMRKTQLTPEGTVSIDGSTAAPPEQLAEMSGLDLDTYALARMVESEAGGLPEAGKLGVAFAALNHAALGSKGIADLLLHSNGAGDGYFGRQDQGRYAATSRDPSAAAVDAARMALEGVVDDPTGGADQWDSPWSYKDSPGETAEEKAARVARARIDAGKELVTLDEVPSRKLRFWRAG